MKRREPWISPALLELAVEDEWGEVLAHNLAVAAGLCRAHQLGYLHGFNACPCGGINDYSEIDAEFFHPGCGRNALRVEGGE